MSQAATPAWRYELAMSHCHSWERGRTATFLLLIHCQNPHVMQAVCSTLKPPSTACWRGFFYCPATKVTRSNVFSKQCSKRHWNLHFNLNSFLWFRWTSEIPLHVWLRSVLSRSTDIHTYIFLALIPTLEKSHPFKRAVLLPSDISTMKKIAPNFYKLSH